MPTSRPGVIPYVLQAVRELQPTSILDVGIGFGKWGHLFREYTDIAASEADPQRYSRAGWQVRIDGIEIYEAYLTPAHRYLYNRIMVGDACELLPQLPCYDLVFLGDVIEHLDKRSGIQLIMSALNKANSSVLVSTPRYRTHQGSAGGNPYESHRSFWRRHDFAQLARCRTRITEDGVLLCALARETGRLPSMRLTRKWWLWRALYLLLRNTAVWMFGYERLQLIRTVLKGRWTTKPSTMLRCR